MPFMYHKKPVREMRKYQRIRSRSLKEIDRIIAGILELMPNRIPIVNNRPVFGSRFVDLCREKGLNLLEMGLWLDNEATPPYNGKATFDKTGLTGINESRVYYQIPHGGIPSDYLDLRSRR